MCRESELIAKLSNQWITCSPSDSLHKSELQDQSISQDLSQLQEIFLHILSRHWATRQRVLTLIPREVDLGGRGLLL